MTFSTPWGVEIPGPLRNDVFLWLCTLCVVDSWHLLTGTLASGIGQRMNIMGTTCWRRRTEVR